MDWDQRLFGVLDELEQQAEAAFGAERDREVADRARAEYARVALVERLAASVDADLVLDLAGPGVVRGRLRRVGADWLLLEAPAGDWVVRADAVVQVRGASPRARARASWSPVQRLGLGSPLRRLADAREPCVLHTTAGTRIEGVLVRVGADFVEVRTPAGEALVALAATAAVSSPQRAEPA